MWKYFFHNESINVTFVSSKGEKVWLRTNIVRPIFRFRGSRYQNFSSDIMLKQFKAPCTLEVTWNVQSCCEAPGCNGICDTMIKNWPDYYNLYSYIIQTNLPLHISFPMGIYATRPSLQQIFPTTNREVPEQHRLSYASFGVNWYLELKGYYCLIKSIQTNMLPNWSSLKDWVPSDIAQYLFSRWICSKYSFVINYNHTQINQKYK